MEEALHAWPCPKLRNGLGPITIHSTKRNHLVTGPVERIGGGPTNYSDADYDDLVPLDCGSGRPPRLGGGFGAGPINNRDADALDFLPSTPTSPRSRHTRRAARVARSSIQTGLARNGSACQSTDGVAAL